MEILEEVQPGEVTVASFNTPYDNGDGLWVVSVRTILYHFCSFASKLCGVLARNRDGYWKTPPHDQGNYTPRLEPQLRIHYFAWLSFRVSAAFSFLSPSAVKQIDVNSPCSDVGTITCYWYWY